MTVAELKKKLEGLDDNMEVLIPVSQEFDGLFYSPCENESGVIWIPTDTTITAEDAQEMELLNKPVPEKDVFVLMPCGFFDEKNSIVMN